MKRKRRNGSRQPSSADWEPRGPGAICIPVCGGSGMLVTGLVPGGSPPPVGVGKDPFHLSAAEEALASSWLQPGNPKESWSPSPRREGPQGPGPLPPSFVPSCCREPVILLRPDDCLVFLKGDLRGEKCVSVWLLRASVLWVIEGVACVGAVTLDCQVAVGEPCYVSANERCWFVSEIKLNKPAHAEAWTLVETSRCRFVLFCQGLKGLPAPPKMADSILQEPVRDHSHPLVSEAANALLPPGLVLWPLQGLAVLPHSSCLHRISLWGVCPSGGGCR
ncbi:uncharacterized protein LOC101022625 [Papio anubis]|uniref:uncharacterized protein LOC101022625 n=1 Tax=Papio anubis TaxID=9555 RepID=UPI0012ADE9A9|nr:uncharacterized protein LOC101022625 [Papio anubis]